MRKKEKYGIVLIYSILCFLLFVFKLSGIIKVSWILVMSILWVPLFFCLIVALVYILIAILYGLWYLICCGIEKLIYFKNLKKDSIEYTKERKIRERLRIRDKERESNSISNNKISD